MPILAHPPVDPNEVALDRILGLPAATYQARIELALTPAEQAAQIGIGKVTLARLEKPGSNPTQNTIVAVLRWLSER